MNCSYMPEFVFDEEAIETSAISSSAQTSVLSATLLSTDTSGDSAAVSQTDFDEQSKLNAEGIKDLIIFLRDNIAEVQDSDSSVAGQDISSVINSLLEDYAESDQR